MDSASILSHSQLFHGIPLPALQELAAKAQLVKTPAGAVVVHEGDRVHGLSVVLEGAVQVRKGGKQATAPLGRGNFFGEISIFGLGLGASATVESPQGATTLVIPPEVLGAWFKLHPDGERLFLRHLAAELCRRLHLTTERLTG